MYRNMKLFRHAVVLSVVFLIVLTLGCSDQRAYIDDARSFCDVHTHEKWKNMSSAISLAELNSLVLAKQRESVKTQAFQQLVNELSEVEFFRDVYPTAKAKIESLTGENWDCPQFRDFYSLRVEKVGSVVAKKGKILTIKVTDDGKYYYEGKVIEFSEADALPKELLEEFQKPSDVEVEVVLAKGAEDSYLTPIFDFLVAKGIGSVKVLSEGDENGEYERDN